MAACTSHKRRWATAGRFLHPGVDVTSVRVAGMVHDFLLLDSLRNTKGADVARHLAIDALKTALH
ncbi:hypothetical protein ACLTEW_23930 [Gordonia lacunae]|uniref:hypothetical protein n=1 Tax=Gordonia lacunae TaxID=417102 RepID=UPI0039E55F61